MKSWILTIRDHIAGGNRDLSILDTGADTNRALVDILIQN